MKSLAIMQPYLFPYVGYMNLVHASDLFVFYDDVNFITRGWINRNTMLINGQEYKFTVPLSNASQNLLISEIKISPTGDFKAKFFKQLLHAYKKNNFFDQGMAYIDRVLSLETDSISELAAHSVKEFFQFIGIKKEFCFSSKVSPETKGIERADRLIAITKQLGFNHYVNLMGGMALYDKPYFLEKGVVLNFIKPTLKKYSTESSPELRLSVIDLVMNISTTEILDHLTSYEII
jgi:hypothetical protein